MKAYDGLDGKKEYEPKRIYHSEKVYVVGNVPTNTIEGFWSQLKRSIDGANHSVSAKHLVYWRGSDVWRETEIAQWL